MALSEAGDPVKTEYEKENEVSKRSENRRKRSRSRSPGRDDRHSRRSHSRSSPKRRRESHHRNRSRSRRSSSRERHRRRDRDSDEDEDGLCKTYPSYPRGRYYHPRSRKRTSRSISRSPSTSSRATSQPRTTESKFDMMPPTLALQIPNYPQLTKPARKIYVGGLPLMVNEAMVAEFFNRTMADVLGGGGGAGADAVMHVYINREKNYAFVEMRSIEDASNAMALDGILFNGVPVKIRRPADYRQDLAMSFGPVQPSPALQLDKVGLTSSNDKVFVGGLPYDWGEDEVRALLEPYGLLRSLDIIKDPETKRSKGYAFCAYQDPLATDVACEALHGKALAGKTLKVHRANVNGVGLPEIVTRVVCLRNAVSEEMVSDEGLFQEVVEDMHEECGKYGMLQRVEIPREPPGVGRVFLEFGDLVSAQKAKYFLHGRKFDERVVQAVYYPEEKFAAGEFGG